MAAQFLLQDLFDPGEERFGQLPAAFLGQVNKVNELFVLAVQAAMGINETNTRVLLRQPLDDC